MLLIWFISQHFRGTAAQRKLELRRSAFCARLLRRCSRSNIVVAAHVKAVFHSLLLLPALVEYSCWKFSFHYVAWHRTISDLIFCSCTALQSISLIASHAVRTLPLNCAPAYYHARCKHEFHKSCHAKESRVLRTPSPFPKGVPQVLKYAILHVVQYIC